MHAECAFLAGGWGSVPDLTRHTQPRPLYPTPFHPQLRLRSQRSGLAWYGGSDPRRQEARVQNRAALLTPAWAMRQRKDEAAGRSRSHQLCPPPRSKRAGGGETRRRRRRSRRRSRSCPPPAPCDDQRRAVSAAATALLAAAATASAAVGAPGATASDAAATRGAAPREPAHRVRARLSGARRRRPRSAAAAP